MASILDQHYFKVITIPVVSSATLSGGTDLTITGTDMALEGDEHILIVLDSGTITVDSSYPGLTTNTDTSIVIDLSDAILSGDLLESVTLVQPDTYSISNDVNPDEVIQLPSVSSAVLQNDTELRINGAKLKLAGTEQVRIVLSSGNLDITVDSPQLTTNNQTYLVIDLSDEDLQGDDIQSLTLSKDAVYSVDYDIDPDLTLPTPAPPGLSFSSPETDGLLISGGTDLDLVTRIKIYWDNDAQNTFVDPAYTEQDANHILIGTGVGMGLTGETVSTVELWHGVGPAVLDSTHSGLSVLLIA